MADRTAIQTAKTELPTQIFLWRKCKCHKNANMGNTYSQFITFNSQEKGKTRLEFLQSRDYGQANLDVLYQPLQLL